MTIVLLAVLGLSLGSFVNALVFRVHEQDKVKSLKAKKGKPYNKEDLSILHGRSMCVHCRHTLAWQDLIPVFSWMALKGRCRYCHKPISWQYPLVELLTAFLFVLSYVSTQQTWGFENIVLFGFWLVFVTGFVALAIYDLKWYLLPNRIVYPLICIALLQILFTVLMKRDLMSLSNPLWGGLVGGGLFYVLFQVSDGKWIGGGDVKLGFLLGLLLAGVAESVLMIFIASLAGTFVALPLLVSGKASRQSHLPFGPFLLFAAIVVQLYGSSMISLYHSFLLPVA